MTRATGDPEPEPLADALARLYDLDLLDDPGDLDLWLALAEKTGGPILELMCGTGRLAVPLAEAGLVVTGVDLDPAMLDRAAARAAAADEDARPRLELVLADVAGLELPGAGTYRLAFVALNSMLLLRTREAQQAAWRAMASHLAPGGLAAMDAWLPDAADLARYDGRLHHEYLRRDPEHGGWVSKTAAAQFDAATGTVALTTFFDEGDPGQPPIRWFRRDVVRLTSADEQRALAESAGLRVELIAGGYDLETLGPHDDRLILLARRPGSTT
jgi:SAM-dependent methyltransferase